MKMLSVLTVVVSLLMSMNYSYAQYNGYYHPYQPYRAYQQKTGGWIPQVFKRWYCTWCGTTFSMPGPPKCPNCSGRGQYIHY